jgi:hypothetical protein
MGKLDRAVRPMGIGLLVIALGLAGLTVYLVVEVRRFASGAERVEGKVVDLVSREGTAGRPKQWAPVVGYEVGGKAYVLKTDRYAFPSRFAVGDKIEVLYSPGDPNDARLGGFRQKYTTAILTGIAAFCLAFMGMGLWKAARRR